jgi:putative spermidine/putrescine transport system substrate-binding protein
VLPDVTSQQEVSAVKTEDGTARAPDVLDIDMATALANVNLFAPYKVSTWSSIPDTQKDPSGLWVQDYGGYMAVGYSGRFGTITSLSQLLGPKFKNAVALNGDPAAANTLGLNGNPASSAALIGVMMANLAEGGTASGIAKGVAFFHQLKAAGNFTPVSATGATIKAGTTPVVFNWDYLSLPGGRLVVCEFSYLPGKRLNAVYDQYLGRGVPRQGPRRDHPQPPHRRGGPSRAARTRRHHASRRGQSTDEAARTCSPPSSRHQARDG